MFLEQCCTEFPQEVFLFLSPVAFYFVFLTFHLTAQCTVIGSECYFLVELAILCFWESFNLLALSVSSWISRNLSVTIICRDAGGLLSSIAVYFVSVSKGER